MKRSAGKKKENILKTHGEIGQNNNIQKASNLLSTFLTLIPHLTVSRIEVSQLSAVSQLERLFEICPLTSQGSGLGILWFCF